MSRPSSRRSRAQSQVPPYQGAPAFPPPPPPPPQALSPYQVPVQGAPPPIYGQQHPNSLAPGPYPAGVMVPPLSHSPHIAPHVSLTPAISPMPHQTARGPRKRLIATCDGTWLDADSGYDATGQAQAPSNVSRIGWAIKEVSSDGIPQVVFYNAGVGTDGGKITRLVSGITGLGLQDNVRETYSFLAVNYAPGDEIFLLGFSRGAWTARSVGGVIGALGLLTRAGMPYFPAIYEDWEHRHDENYISKQPDVPFPKKPSFSHPSYVSELVRLGLTRTNIPIRAIGVWDTVGSLGIPRLGFFENLGIQAPNVHEYSFFDTSLGLNVENAFQALALDEHRSPFTPALWEKPKGSNTNLKQVWFPGVHSNIGGSYEDTDLANITLAWMISRLEPFIDFRQDYLLQQCQLNRAYYKSTRQRPRPWSFGYIRNSLRGFYSLAGSKTRTPGSYYRVDPYTGRPTTKLLRSTNEFIHASVRARFILHGPGIEDKGDYLPRALRDWDVIRIEEPGPASTGFEKPEPIVIWRKAPGAIRGAASSLRRRMSRATAPKSPYDDDKNHLDGGPLGGEEEEGQSEIPEAALLESEIRLLGLASSPSSSTSPQPAAHSPLEAFVLSLQTTPPPPQHSSSRRRRRGGAASGVSGATTADPNNNRNSYAEPPPLSSARATPVMSGARPSTAPTGTVLTGVTGDTIAGGSQFRNNNHQARRDGEREKRKERRRSGSGVGTGTGGTTVGGKERDREKERERERRRSDRGDRGDNRERDKEKRRSRHG